MSTSLIKIDGFYNNADEVRQFALTQRFDEVGNYPGRRTVSFLNDSTKQTIQAILRPYAGTIKDWSERSSGSFNITTADDHGWIHCDGCSWSGLIYLTPNAPLSAGTGFYQHKATGLFQRPEDEDLLKQLHHEGNDVTKWQLTDVVANRYNRLILFPGRLFHAPMDYFGQRREDGRMIQVFFLKTEY